MEELKFYYKFAIINTIYGGRDMLLLTKKNRICTHFRWRIGGGQANPPPSAEKIFISDMPNFEK